MPLEVSDDQARLLAVLFPQLNDLELEQVEDTGASVRILARTRTQTAACRGCGTLSARPHDRYRRRLHDLSCGGRPVVVELGVRRFRCDMPTCPVATFAEQVDGLTERHQRRSVRLRRLLERLALTAAGRAGARLAHALGATVSRFTLLRLVRALPDPPIGQITVLGVDDFAKHKGHSYATVLLDMDDHRVVDVLPDREADTFARWLIEHPGVQVICRDRAGAYAAGAREGAPGARQVADRFHLWQNMGEAVEKTVITHRAALREPEPDPDTEKAAGKETAPSADPAETPVTESALKPGAGSCAPPEPDGARDVLGRQRRLLTRHRERYTAVHALRAEGHSLTEIGRRLGIGQDTVRRFARATSIEEVLFKATHRASILEEFKPYLNQRWNDGVTNAATLHAELRTRGWTGSIQAVRRYLRQFRPADGRTRAARTAPRTPTAPATPAPPKPRKVTKWIMTRPDHLTSDEATHLTRILDRSPELAATATHVHAFATMMTNLQGHNLDQWIDRVRADPLPALHSFATGLQRDHDAVLAGLTLPHNSGAVEGTVCKIKFLKRLMFGRANFDLLRAMALHN